MAKRPSIKQILRYLLWGGLLASLVMLFAGFLSSLAWLTTPGLAERAASRLAPLAGGEVTFGAMRFSYEDRLLLATDGVITLADGATLTFRRMEARFRLASLLAGTVRIDDFHLYDPVVTLPPTAVADTAQPATPGMTISSGGDARLAPSHIAIPFVTVAFTTLRIENARIEGPGFLAGGLDLKGRAEIGPKGLTFSLALTTGVDAPLRLGNGDGSPMLDAVASIAVNSGMERSGRFVMTMKGGVSPRSATGPRRIAARLDVEGSLYTPQLKAKAIADLDGARFLEGDANVEAVGPKVRYDVTIDKLSVELERLLQAAGVKGVDVAGTVHTEQVQVTGHAWRNGIAPPTATVTGGVAIRLQRFEGGGIALPSGGEAVVDLTGLSTGGSGMEGPLVVTVTTPDVRYGHTVAAGVSLGVKGVFEGDAAKGKFDIDLTTDRLNAPDPLGAFTGTARLSGDPITGDLVIEEAALRLPNRKSGVTVTGEVGRYGDQRFRLDVGYDLLPHRWRSLLEKRGGDQLPHFAGRMKGIVKLEGERADGVLRGSMALDGTVAGGRFEAGSVELTGVGMAHTASCRFDEAFRLADFEAAIKVAGGPLTLGRGKGRSFTLDLHVTSPHPVTDPFVADLAVGLVDFVGPHGGEPLAPKLTLIGQGGGESGGRIDRFVLDLGTQGAVTGKGEYDPKAGKIDVTLTGDRVDLASVAALVPPELLPLTDVAGALSMSLAMEGEREEGGPWYPFRGHGRLMATLEGGRGTVVGRGKIEGADLNLAVTLEGKEITVASKGGIGSVVVTGYNGGKPVSPMVDLSASTDGTTVTLQRLVFDAAGDGIVHSLDGAVTGVDLPTWSRDGVPPNAELLRKVSARLNGYTLFAFGETPKSVAPDVTAQGEVELAASLTATAGEAVVVEGSLFSDRLSFRSGETVDIQGIAGEFPFKKRLVYDFGDGVAKNRAPTTAPTELRNMRFYADLTAAVTPAERFTIDQIEAGPLHLLATVFEMTFRQNRFGIDAFTTRFAGGGGVAGEMRIEGEEGEYRLALAQTFAGIDLAALAGERSEKSDGDRSTVAGSLGLMARFNATDTAERLDLTRVELAFHLTRIDKKALDQLLAFIDPEGKSPAVTGARTALRFATPVAADIIARYGTLSVDIALRYTPLLGGQTVVMPVVRNAPIRGLVNFGAIKEATEKAAVLIPVAQAIGSGKVMVAPDGSLSVQ